MPDYVLYFDGGCEPVNPGGNMTCAYVVQDTAGADVLSDAKLFKAKPQNTNNVAEYFALGLGIKAIREAKLVVDRLTVRGDSQLVIKQVNGEWKCKSDHLFSLLARCVVQLCDLTKDWKAEWIPREQNARADALGRELLDRETRDKPGIDFHEALRRNRFECDKINLIIRLHNIPPAIVADFVRLQLQGKSLDALGINQAKEVQTKLDEADRITAGIEKMKAAVFL